MSFRELKEEVIRAFMVKVDAIDDEAALRDLLHQLRAMPPAKMNKDKNSPPAKKILEVTH